MFYLFDSKLLKSKSVFVSLINIFGIGKFNSILICKQLGFCNNFKTKNLSQDQFNKIVKLIDYLNIKIANNLKKLRAVNTKTQILIKCYKGIRKIKGLPVRGQRTHTNCKTVKKFIKNDCTLFN